jgi:hypothetical protein
MKFGELLADLISHPHQVARLHTRAALSHAPVTSTAATAAAHTSAADTRPPRAAAADATRLQTLPGRLPVIRAARAVDPGSRIRPGRPAGSLAGNPGHPGWALALRRGCGG